jgi:hypothetical protein
MFDPTLNERRSEMMMKLKCAKTTKLNRKGAVAPLFAFMLPVLLIFCGFAINLAYMQKVSTELKVATDASAHAGGRAMSVHQTTDAAIAQAELTAQANLVGGQVISISASENDEDHFDAQFGLSTRGDGGYGMYEFTGVDKDDVDTGVQRATSIAINTRIELPVVFNVMNYGNFGEFAVNRRSIATQVDRDIALVLDRSGSMLYYEDDEALTDTLYDLYSTYETSGEEGYWMYAYWERSGWWYYWRGYHKEEDAESDWEFLDWWDKYYVDGSSSSDRLISWDEYQDATKSLYSREYSNNVIYQLEKWTNDDHTLGTSFSSSESNKLTQDMAEFAYDWEYNSSQAARHSRWDLLEDGVDAFLDILENTDQEELVSLVTFNTSTYLEYELQSDYDLIRNKVAGIKPYDGTAIGDGMLEGVDPIISGDDARLFAAKTIVVLTDGENNAGEEPEDAAEDIIEDNNVTIHTVTFTPGADQDAMEDVAATGYGRHYHADEGDGLVAIFEEIANNLPTILTE